MKYLAKAKLDGNHTWGAIVFKSILDPEFQYRNAASTDVRKTFERIRRQQRLEQHRKEGQSSKVVATIGRGPRVTSRSGG